MKKTKRAASLRRHRHAHTVLLRVAVDRGRAKRIHDLKQECTKAYAKMHNGERLTWKVVGEACEVTERSATKWGSTGEIKRDNSVKLTEFFRSLGAEIADDYIWRGPMEEAPLMDEENRRQNQLDRIEAMLLAICTHLSLDVEKAMEDLKASFGRPNHEGGSSPRREPPPEDRRAA